MFRTKDSQRTLFESRNLVPPSKQRRLQASWAETFRAHALPLIDEEQFAPLYCDDNGRPNQPVATVLGVLLAPSTICVCDQLHLCSWAEFADADGGHLRNLRDLEDGPVASHEVSASSRPTTRPIRALAMACCGVTTSFGTHAAQPWCRASAHGARYPAPGTAQRRDYLPRWPLRRRVPEATASRCCLLRLPHSLISARNLPPIGANLPGELNGYCR